MEDGAGRVLDRANELAKGSQARDADGHRPLLGSGVSARARHRRSLRLDANSPLEKPGPIPNVVCFGQQGQRLIGPCAPLFELPIREGLLDQRRVDSANEEHIAQLISPFILRNCQPSSRGRISSPDREKAVERGVLGSLKSGGRSSAKLVEKRLCLRPSAETGENMAGVHPQPSGASPQSAVSLRPLKRIERRGQCFLGTIAVEQRAAQARRSRQVIEPVAIASECK